MARALKSLCLVLLFACSGNEPPPEGAAPASAEKPALTRVTADRGDLLFTWRGEDGAPATATALADVPEPARGAVQVVDLSLTPEQRAAGAFVQVFDLRAPGPDGAFPGRLVPRAELEAALAAQEAEARPAQAAVTMYSASWCGVCRKARGFLTESGIAFIEKDIEKDPGAAQELTQKARAAGVSASGVPVFDVGGRILAGFDPDSLLRAIKKGG